MKSTRQEPTKEMHPATPGQGMRGWIKTLGGLAVAAGLALCAGVVLAAAPKLCVPVATGVAYQSGPPNWWDAPPPAAQGDVTYNRELMITTDPRWRGALSVDYGMGATTNAEFRGLVNGSNELLLSWAVKGFNFNVGFTSLVLGIKTNSGAPVVLRMSVMRSTTEASPGGVVQAMPPVVVVNNNPVEYIAFKNYTWDAAQSKWIEHGGAPANWASDATRIWIKPTSVAGNGAWLIQMRVPLAQLGWQPGQSFHLWYSMQPSINVGTPALIHYTWPKDTASGDYTYYTSMGTIHLPDPNNAATPWGEVAVGTQAGCAGIKLADGDIGVANSQFPGDRSRISLFQKNTFFALPQNVSGGNLNMSNLTATFYFADWGSQVGSLVANQSWTPEPTLMTDLTAANPNLDWHVSATPQATSPNQFDAAVEVLGGAPRPNPVSSNKKAQLWRDWTLVQAEQCRFFDPANPATFLANTETNNANYCSGVSTAPFAPHSVHPHGCMLVKLNGPGQVFLNDSAFRNMNFGTASVYQRDARISVAGLGKSSSGMRNVYLLSDKRNMPPYRPVLKFGRLTAAQVVVSREALEINAMMRAPEKVRSVATPAARRLLENSPMLNNAVLGRNPALAKDMARMRIAVDRPAIQPGFYDSLATVLPTYALHVFHDADKTIYIDGQPHSLLEQQTSFGVYLLHDQNYFGWVEQVTGNALEVAPGVKKMSIPDGKSALLTQRLEAVEKIKPLRDYREIELPLDRIMPGRIPQPAPVIR